MSTSLASAKKRRANITEPQPQQFRQPQQQQQQMQQSGGGLTLPQVIKLVDTRLLNLEKIVAEKKNGDEESEETSLWIEEFNKRTEIIAMEIDSIKSIVLQLQSFTMEVNKKLFEKVEALTAATQSSNGEIPTSTISDAEQTVVPAELTSTTEPTTVSTEEPSDVSIISRFDNKSNKSNNITITSN